MHDTLLHDGCGRVVEQLHESGRFELITFETPRTHKWEGASQRFSMGATIARKIRNGNPLQFDSAWMNVKTGFASQETPYIRHAMRKKTQ